MRAAQQAQGPSQGHTGQVLSLGDGPLGSVDKEDWDEGDASGDGGDG